MRPLYLKTKAGLFPAIHPRRLSMSPLTESRVKALTRIKGHLLEQILELRVALADVITQMDLTDIYRKFHPNRKENTFFSAPHGTFSKIGHILGNKANLKHL